MSRLRRLFFPVVAWWHHLPLRWQGVVKAGSPLLAVLFTAGMALLGNHQRAQTEAALLRHFSLDEQLAELLTLMLNAETGLRGHLIARQPEFLAPYQLAERDLPGTLASLTAFVDAEPGEQPRRERQIRLEAIRRTIAEEMALLGELRGAILPAGPGTTSGAANGLDALLARSKATMDQLRVHVRKMRVVEQSLLAERLSDIQRVRRRDYLTIAGALLLGIGTRVFAFIFFQRRIVERVDQLNDNLRAIEQGQPAPHAPSGTRDAIGKLEGAIARLEPKRDRPTE